MSKISQKVFIPPPKKKSQGKASHPTQWETNWSIIVADIISTVEFDHTGNYLATGDKGGRVVLFERNETVSQLSSQHQ
jgi:serine/threonine-protein phosphatase 2A regulatory subunit B